MAWFYAAEWPTFAPPLTRSQGFWLIAGVYAHSNGAVPANVSVAAYQFAAAHGVLDRKVRDRSDKSLEALRRLSGRHFDWDV